MGGFSGGAASVFLGHRGVGVSSSPYLLVEDVAVRLHRSRRSVHELTRNLEIPHRKLPGSRRCLFLLADLEAWESGAELEVQEFDRGGRIVRPRPRSSS